MPPRSRWFYVFAIPTSLFAGLGYAHSVNYPPYLWARENLSKLKLKFKNGTPPSFD